MFLYDVQPGATRMTISEEQPASFLPHLVVGAQLCTVSVDIQHTYSL